MVEHTVILDRIGGANALSCPTLRILNIEMPWEPTAENIQKRILEYTHETEEHADFDLVIVDNRPPEENFNEKKARESKQFNKNHNTL
ncbi:MAG: hypothetical protein ACW99F_03380 [Candidatus Hodarchaeales archaeon]|jgi:guanylate kinase